VDHASLRGLHHFTFRSPYRQAAWLASAIDPNGRVQRAEPPQQAKDIDDLDPHPDRLAETCETSALVYYGSHNADGQSAERALTAYSSPAGVYLLTGWGRPPPRA
jgi:hypothetical protein